MKRNNVLIFIFCIILSLCLFVACKPAQAADKESILYQSNEVTVTVSDNKQEVNYVFYEYIELTEDIAYKKNTVILTGTAVNVREAEISYEYLGANVTDNITLFDISVSNVINCRSNNLPESSILTVGIPYNSNNYEEGTPAIKEGSSYLLFCYLTADSTNDPLEMSKYVDCWISNPCNLLCEEVGNYYITTEFFSGIKSSCNLIDILDLSSYEVDELAAIDGNNTALFRDYVDEHLASTDTEAADIRDSAITALSIIKNRTSLNSSQLLNILENSYLANCSELENHVKTVALSIAK